MSATLVSAGRVHRHDLNAASAQLAGAAAVGLLASIPVLLTPHSAELESAELTLAAFIGIVGYAVARGGGASRVRSIAYAAIVLIAAVAIAIVKNALSGH